MAAAESKRIEPVTKTKKAQKTFGRIPADQLLDPGGSEMRQREVMLSVTRFECPEFA